MAVDVLRHGVDLDIRAQFSGPEAEKAAERGVHGEKRAVVVRQFRDRFDVSDLRSRIARILHVDQLRVGPDGGFYRFRVGCIYERDLYAVLSVQRFVEERFCGNVADLGHDRVISGLQKRGEYGRKRSHAAAENDAVFRVSEPAQLVLEDKHVHVAFPLVNKIVDPGRIEVGTVGRKSVIRGHIDRLVDGTERIVLSGAGVYGDRCGFHR